MSKKLSEITKFNENDMNVSYIERSSSIAIADCMRKINEVLDYLKNEKGATNDHA